jgi:hypothetical protein
MSRFCLLLSRCCFPAWVGAAVLFVVNAVAQVTFPGFDSTLRNQLVLLRFPAYYAFGFGLVGTGLASLAIGGLGRLLRPRVWRWAVSCASAALVLMLVDYLFVYLPLEAMITPPTAPRPANFTTLHRLSTGINAVHVGLSALAAVLVNWPGAPEPPSER